MAQRPKGYGMTAELNEKKAAKYDSDLARETLGWVQTKLQSSNPSLAASINLGACDADSVHNLLKSGVILVELVKALEPSKKIKVNESKMAFKMMENIGNFLTFCESKGCNKTDLFQTVDLYEAQNMMQVINGIQALGRKYGDIGPKEADQNKREFTEDQLKAGQHIIGLQMGSNKGATQAGQSFGKTRAILD